MKFTRMLSLAITGLLAVGLVACNSDHEPAGDHDHGAHESEAGDHDGGHGDHGDHDGDGHDMDAMGGDDAAAMPGLNKIEPSADYPLKTCVVSGEELGGSMGDAIAYEYDGQEIQFCCEGCLEEFMESPEKFVAKVKAAAAK